MMKFGSGQIFPIALLALVAGLSFWLQASLTADTSRAARADDGTPDAFATNFEIRRLDDDGALRYRLRAPELKHFPGDEISEIRSPELIAYRQDTPPITITAGLARVSKGGDLVQLTDSVRVRREATPERAELLVSSPSLNVYPETGLAETDQAVTITQGASKLSGVGARIDNKASTFELRSQVRGQYIAQRAQP